MSRTTAEAGPSARRVVGSRALRPRHRHPSATWTRISPRPGRPRDRITERPSSISACPALPAAVAAQGVRARGTRRPRSAGRGTGRSSGGGSRGRRRTGDPRPIRLVRLALQGLRQSLLARHTAALVLGAAHQRGPHHHRHQLRLGHTARDHRRSDDAGAQSARHQVRDHQPRSRRSRSGRGGAPEPLRRQGGDGRRRLGFNAAAASHRCRRRTEARHRSRTGGTLTSPWATRQ